MDFIVTVGFLFYKILCISREESDDELLSVLVNHIAVIYVTARRFAGRLKKFNIASDFLTIQI